MAYKVLEGKYKAKVLPFTFEQVGKNEAPAIVAHFKPIGPYVGDAVQAEESLPEQQFMYFLSLDIADKGKYAGKSRLEILKIELKEIYGYEGPLDAEAINTAVANKEVDLVCEPNEYNGKTYTKVKYVNAVGGAAKGKKPIKHLSADSLAAFNKAWNSAQPAPAQDAKSLFAQLTGATDAK